MPSRPFFCQNSKVILNPGLRRASTAAVRCMAVVDVAGHTLLAAAYSDASLRLWDLGRQACLLHSSLLPSAAQEGPALPTHTAFAPPPADEPGRPGKLVVQLDEPDQAAGASRFYAYELYGSAGAGASLTGLDMQQVNVSLGCTRTVHAVSACLAYHLVLIN